MAYEPIADKHGYRGILFRLSELGPNLWEWVIYPKIEQGRKQSGQVNGTRNDAESAYRTAIDKMLGNREGD